MDVIIEFAKIILPAALVLYAMYLTMRSMVVKELRAKAIDLKVENDKTILPLRLQAYERMCLYLERISPGHLLPTLNEPGLTARNFQNMLVRQIREELSHNLSQQIYMSDRAWNLIKSSTEDIITLINAAGEKMGEDAKSTDLAKEVVAQYMAKNEDTIGAALSFVKDEIREIF